MNEYSAVSAKIKAMYRGCLDKSDYDSLISRKSVIEVCEYLKSSTSYEDEFLDVDVNQIHRGGVEVMLNHKMFSQYIRLYNFMDKKQRDFIQFWFMRMEIEYLKHKIRYIFNHEKEQYIKNEDEESKFFLEHTKIDCDLAEKATSLAEFAEACKATPFYEVLKTAESIKSDFFSLSMMFDRLYYIMLWKAKDKLPKKEREAFEKYLGPSVDMLNIMWIYRGKKYFDFDKEIIFTYLIPVSYRVSKDDIKMMASGADETPILEYVSNSRYKDLFLGVGEDFFAEENFHSLEVRQSKRIFVDKPYTMAAIFAYFKLKQTEIYNITTIIEGVRYGIDPNVLRKHVKV